MNAKQRAERYQQQIEAARQEIANRCAYCRIYVPPLNRLVWEGEKFYCSWGCRDASREVAAMLSKVE
jgi:hypothetical protein